MHVSMLVSVHQLIAPLCQDGASVHTKLKIINGIEIMKVSKHDAYI